MKELILILALGISLAACAAETPLPTVTPVPPTITLTPTASIRDRGVEFPSASSIATERPAASNPKPVESPAGSRITMGRPATSTPTPTVAPLGDQPASTSEPAKATLAEQYVAHFVERGFEYYNEMDQYVLEAGRGVLVIKVTDTSQIVAYVMIEPMTDEEVVMVREHLIEAGEFLDPGHGWETIQSAFETIAMGITDNGTAWAKGREIHWLTLWQNAYTNMVVFEFPNVPTYVGTPIDG